MDEFPDLPELETAPDDLLARQWGELRKAIEFAAAKSGKAITLK